MGYEKNNNLFEVRKIGILVVLGITLIFIASVAVMTGNYYIATNDVIHTITKHLTFGDISAIPSLHNMRNVVEDGRTVIACSHDPNHVAWFCDRVVVVGNCGVIADGSPVETINERTLDLIYQNTCAVQTAGGIRIVMPADLQTRKAGKMQENSYNQHAFDQYVEQNAIRRIDYDIGYDKLEQ